jgi:DNA protecting protein DprA
VKLQKVTDCEKALNNFSSEEIVARAQLFAGVEAGTTFWSREVFEKGAVKVLELCKAGEYREDVKSILKSNGHQVLEKLAEFKINFLIPGNQFDELPAPPIGLTYRGDIQLLERRIVAIVGTRNPTPYGSKVAAEFAANFADREWVVASGGAYGIDSAAHKGALMSEGETIAVMASGLDVLYPAGNSRLFSAIEENGLLISEYMPGTPALPFRFLNRNRIIAAISEGTIVVEAAFRSGSLRTARDAESIRRKVLAIPGPINSPLSEGCHRLIGEGAAVICTGVNDALELMR